MITPARRTIGHAIICALLFSLVASALPPSSAPLAPSVAAASGETVTSPRYISVAVMPNGQVGMIVQNNGAEIRFKRYTDEQATDPSLQLSTAAPGYPQITTFKGELVAGYTDTRAPNAGRFIFRISSDDGATWGAEFYPFGAETFDSSVGFAPVATTSRDGQSLYFFNASGSVIPTYRSTTDLTLTTWTTPGPAGDATMRTAGGNYGGNNCGNAGAECYRAHLYQFMETAIPGRWIYIAKSDSGYGQSGRGTQFGTLGGAWSAQIDLGGSGGLSGGGESGATTFLDRFGNVLYVRAGEVGENVYFQKSIDNGTSWGPRVYAYNANQPNYLTAAPVGVYVPGYTQGEYVWWAGFGGTQDTVRVDGLWNQALPYAQTGTARVFGSAGGDWDAGLAWTYTFGKSDPDASAGTGVYTTSASDLALPGRLLNLGFGRTYNSADTTNGPLGPGWTHTYNWSLIENQGLVRVRRGDGRRDKFTAIGGGAYSNPPNVFDKLVKNADSTFTLTLTNQVAYEFSTAGVLTRIHEPAGNQITLAYTGGNLTTITDTVGRVTTLSYGLPANLARGHTYTESVAPDPSYPDTGGVELTDGIIPSGSDFRDPAWQGHYNLATPLDVTIDLGTAQNIGATQAYFYDGTDGIFKPASVELLTSTDNITFTSRGVTAAAASVNDSAHRWRYDNVANASARWLRFHLVSGGTWLFSGEYLAYPQGAGVPPPPEVGARLGKIQDNAGRAVTYGYDTAGRLTAAVDKIGNGAGQNPALHTWQYGYEPTGQHITTITDPDGRVRVTNTFDSAGRLATQKDGLLKLTAFAYSPSQTVVTDPRNHQSTLTYDARQRLLSQSDVVSGITRTLQYGYDTAGNRNVVFDRDGNRTDFVYDTSGNVLTKTDPQLNPQTPRYVTTFAYDPKNNVTQITDPRTFVTTNTYDATTNVLLSTTAQIDQTTTAVTKYEYGDALNPGLPTRIISPRGNSGPTPNYTYSQSLSYDAQANLVQRIDADAAKTTYGYDTSGRRTSMVDPDGYAAGGVPAQHTWLTAYDDNDRVTSQSDPLGHSTGNGYDRSGDRTTLTDRNGFITTYAYDNAARLQTVSQKPDPVNQPALTYSTTLTRDNNGNATKVTQANNVVTDYTFDELNRLTSVITHPTTTTSLTTSYVLNGNGQPTTKTTGDGVAITYVYDTMARLTSVAAVGLTTITYGYDALSHRTAMADTTGSTSYAYDGLGRLTQAVQPNGTSTYGYDLDSNRTALGYPTVGNVAYAYSPGGRLGSVTDWASRLSTYQYTAAGLASSVAVPGGMSTTYTYDNAHRLTQLVNAVGANTVSSHAYTLDNEGNRTALDELVSGITAPPVQAFPSVKVNSDATTTVQDHPAIALGADAASYLVWDDARSGNPDIQFARRDPLTGTWSANVKVNSDTGTRGQLNPAIAVDGANNAYAVWQDDRDGTGSKIDTNIYFSKRAAGTGLWGVNLKVNDDTTGNPVQRNPRIAVTSAGVASAAWVDLRASQINIYGSTLASGGSAWAANKRISDNTVAAKDSPDVVVGADGTTYAVWQDSRNGNLDIYFSKLTSGGSAWSANQKVSDDPGTAAQTAPRIGVDSAGNITVIWLDARTTPATVRMSRQLSGTSTWIASTLVSDAAARPVAPLALSQRSDGNAWAAWTDSRIANTDIWGSQYTGGTWTTSTKLSDDPGSFAQSSPALAYSSAELASAWRDDRAGNADIRAAHTAYNPGVDHFAYGYDGLERLTGVTVTNPESFTLDAGSNIASRTGPTATYTYDTANRLTNDGTQTFTWNTADRLTNRGSDIFGYDPLDRMTSSTVAATARTYAYNGDGLLQSRTQGTATTFLWDPSSSPSRLLTQGGDRLVYGLGPLYVVKADGTTSTFARDGGKSVRAEVNGSGTVTASFRYRAYGAISQSSGAATPTYLGYAGQLVDPSGLLYMRARWYDPGVGRFVTRDALGGDAAEPAGLNGFGYGDANPATQFDPAGLASQDMDTSSGGACRHVSTCGELASEFRNELIEEAQAADDATRSSNEAIRLTGYVEKGAAVVAVGALGVAGGAAVVSKALPTFLVSTGLAEGISFAGAGTDTVLRVAGVLAAKYGGDAANWAHMTTRGFVRIGGKTIQIHWFEEVVQEITTGAKWKIQ